MDLLAQDQKQQQPQAWMGEAKLDSSRLEELAVRQTHPGLTF
jgi:hypothetical protein